MNEPNEPITQIKDTTGNPAPLGLLGFGMTTVLLNLHNAGFYELNSMILAMGICYGGAAQIIAGIMEWKKGNTFATTAFISYGSFWWSLVALILLAKLGWAGPSQDRKSTRLNSSHVSISYAVFCLKKKKKKKDYQLNKAVILTSTCYMC